MKARDLLVELHRRAPKDIAVCAGIGLVAFVPPHKLSRAAHEARAIATRAARRWHAAAARDAFAAHYALLSLRAEALGDAARAEKFRRYAVDRSRVAA